MRLIDANALRAAVRKLPTYVSASPVLDAAVLALIDAAPTVVPDDARLRAIIEERFMDQGLGPAQTDDWDTIESTIALAVDDIMEYLGAKATPRLSPSLPELALEQRLRDALPGALALATEQDETYGYSDEPGSPYVMFLAQALAAGLLS